MQRLLDLHEHLQLSVLSAVMVPLPLQLVMLPESMQSAALHAAFPSIAATASITIRDMCCMNSIFWDLVGKETSLKKSLSLCSDSVRRARAGEQLLASLGNLSTLESFAIPGLSSEALSLTELVSCLSCQGTLQHLDISGTIFLFVWFTVLKTCRTIFAKNIF